MSYDQAIDAIHSGPRRLIVHAADCGWEYVISRDGNTVTLTWPGNDAQFTSVVVQYSPNLPGLPTTLPTATVAATTSDYHTPVPLGIAAQAIAGTEATR